MITNIKLPTAVTTSMAEVGFVRAMPFFIKMVVKLTRRDDRSASAIAMSYSKVQGSAFKGSGSEVLFAGVRL